MASQVRRPESPGRARLPADVLGARVRARRADLGLRQAELAQAMSAHGHAWTHGTVSRIETAQSEPTLSELISLMLLLGSTFEDLLDAMATGGGPVDAGPPITLSAPEFNALLSGDESTAAAWRLRKGKGR